jgi:hypothetical protein
MNEVDPQLERYYTEYVDLYNQVCPMAHYSKPIQMSIQFDNLEGEIIGYCKEHLGGWDVRIDKTFWSYAVDEYKNSLAAHEILGHCMLKLEHRTDIKDHYMQPVMTYTSPEMLQLQMRGDIVKRCRDIYVRPAN